MDKQFMFTIIVKNSDDNLIKSIINQDIGFKDNVQLILLENSENYYHESYPKNILTSSDFNPDDIRGRYVNFTDGKTPFQKDFLSKLEDFISKNEINIVTANGKNGIFDIAKDYKHSFLDCRSTFINSTLIDDFSEDFFLSINQALISEKKFECISDSVGGEKPLCNRIGSYEKLINHSDDDTSKFVQYAIISDLSSTVNLSDCSKVKQIREILENIDEKIIKKHDKLNDQSRKFLLFLKTGDFHHEIKNEKLYLKTSKTTVNVLHKHQIRLDIVEIRNGFLNISGFFRSSCDLKFLDFEAVLSNDDGSKEIIKTPAIEYVTTDRKRKSFLGIDWQYSPCFDFKIPVSTSSRFKINLRIRFHEDGDEFVFYPDILLNRKCGLSEFSNYFVKDSKVVMFKDNSICIKNESFSLKTKLEVKSMLSIIKSDEKHSYYSIFIRIIYFALNIFWKNKRIWLFEDRPLIADDNAKHLFLYASKQDDNVNSYYILDRNSKDFAEMKKLSGNIVELGSLKHKMLYLFAEKFISSHSGEGHTNPFADSNPKLFSGMTTIEKVFLQHGITIHEVSYWLRKYYHNFFLFVTASDLEHDSITTPNYNYGDDVVKTFGFPRYDNLTNEDLKKQILFMPTWRKDITSAEELVNSDYFRMINDMFNNERLLGMLNEHGYKIVFKPHFELIKYYDMFDVPDEVILAIDEPYQELFNKSMLLITDYSSVFFDFAYLKKPVIYYRNDDDFHYDSGYFDFQKMGFGEVVNSLDDLVNLIESNLENGCSMQEKYLKRVDKFFKYNDKNNCKRVYDWLYENK